MSAVVLLVGAVWIWASQAPPGSTTQGAIPAPQQGFQAPDFSLTSLQGETFSLSEYRGHPVLVNFWASWCPPCKSEMPAFEAAYQANAEQGFIILAVNATDQDQLANAQAFVQSYQLTFPVLLDTQGEASRLYQLNSLPTSFFVDRQGTIREVVVGGMSEALLRIRMQNLLQENP